MTYQQITKRNSLPDYIITQEISLWYWVLKGLCMYHRTKLYCNTRHLCVWVLRDMYMLQDWLGLYYEVEY